MRADIASRTRWRMGGIGLVAPLTLPARKFRRLAPEGVEPSVLPLTNRIPGFLFLARYDSTSTMSYSELGVGIFARSASRRLGFYCTHLWVDTEESIRAGREIWALSKRRASFDWQKQDGRWYVSAATSDGELLSASFDAPRTGFSLPASLRCFSLSDQGEVLRWSVRSRSAMARTRVTASVHAGAELEGIVRRRMFGMFLEPLDLSLTAPGRGV